jgi:ubiquinone/menaquinone biosynthesis C-methylase UbiE/DNA-binding transcriptional ArsR family regulator
MKLDLATTTELFRLLADETRVRLLALLEREELTVAELTRIAGLAQSRVSTHLARLRDAELIVDRKQGASTFYRLADDTMPEAARRTFELVRTHLADALLERDLATLAEVLAARNGAAGNWAESVAGQMDRHYSPGRTWEATAWGALGLARLGRVLDVAAGDGVTAELLSHRAERVICVDRSAKVVAAGRRRLARLENVAYVQADMHALPFADASFDQVLAMHVLTYTSAPALVLAELGRVLKPGGMLVAATLERHAHHDVRTRFDHVTLGYECAELSRLLRKAGFSVELCKVTSRERQKPHHGVITIHAHKLPPGATNGAMPAATRNPRRHPRLR